MLNSYAIIVENDESQWDYYTGLIYHFPYRYLKYLQPGTSVIYYKGRQRNSIYKNKRLSKETHYFGFATIGDITSDQNQSKNFFANIADLIPFIKPVFIRKEDGQEYEVIPPSRIKNYWRDGVRPISKEIYDAILDAVGIQEATTITDIPILSLDTVFPSLSASTLLKFRKQQSSNKNDKKSIGQVYYSPNAKKIGDRGEEIVFNYLKSELSLKELRTLRWLANEKITPGYDIEYQKDDGNKICIEVKSTAAKAFTPFFYNK